MFKLLAFSAARSDYDRYYPILNGLRKHPKLRLKLIVGSNHFLKKFGNTKSLIDKKFNLLELKKYSIDSKQNIVANLSKEIIEISKIFSKEKPNALVLFGDRYDMFVGISAIPFNIPIIHLYGGAVTEGAIDEQIDTQLLKLVTLHLVANENYYKRVVQMGEEKMESENKIGVPELKYLLERPIMSINKLSNEMKIDISKPTLLSTFHPENFEYSQNN